ncbi:MAG: ATP-dependent Clp protease proteolytic subunit [Burkholderiaceae bacterium]|nr:ATP-dependent Clp protease proteolytic subunit [Burkholderiaceae bacterium]
MLKDLRRWTSFNDYALLHNGYPIAILACQTKVELYTIISNHSGKPFEEVEKDSDRDYWMTSEEAKAYGMIDDVLVRK